MSDDKDHYYWPSKEYFTGITAKRRPIFTLIPYDIESTEDFHKWLNGEFIAEEENNAENN